MNITNKHKNQQGLTDKQAEQILNNIFDACDLEHNTTPLKELAAYVDYRKDRFKLRKTLIALAIILFLATPLFFITPEVTNITASSDSTGSTSYSLTVRSALPVASVSATIDGEEVPVYETAHKCYTIESTTEGTIWINVTLVNHQYTTTTLN